MVEVSLCEIMESGLEAVPQGPRGFGIQRLGRRAVYPKSVGVGGTVDKNPPQTK